MNTFPKRATGRSDAGIRLKQIVAGIAAIGSIGALHAFELDTGNSDLKIRLDNSVRYNIGVRAGDPDARMKEPTNAMSALGNFQSKKGDVIINRLDLLSEFDVIYKERSGLRVSAALWGDATDYGKLDTSSNPAFPTVCAGVYANCEFSAYTKRYAKGPSGEILDAFLFTGFDIGATTTSLKLGRHNLYWGNSLFPQSKHVAIANQQSAMDLQKAALSPGIEAKELFIPQNQISFATQFTPEISVAGYRSYEWRKDRLPEGGTYFDFAAAAFHGPNGPAIHAPINEPDSSGGDWGVMAKWSPAALDGANVGVYYREFYEKVGNPFYINSFGQYGLGYNPVKNKLLAASAEANLAGMNWGMEVTYRKNASLSARIGGAGAGFVNPINGANLDGPRGDLFGVVLNTMLLLPKTSLWETGVVVAELAYQHLDKVTYNPAQFNGTAFVPNSGYFAEGSPRCLNANFSGPGDASNGCATNNSLALSFQFAPQWLQVAPGVNMTAPLFVSYGLKGNAASGAIGAEGAISYSLGLQFDIQNRHKIKLAYNGSRAPLSYAPTNAALARPMPTVSGAGSWWQNDHGWVSLSYSTSF